MFDRKVVLALVIGFAACWFVGNGCTLKPAEPLANRPIIKWIAKAAKTLLWVAVFVEPAPEAKAQAHACDGSFEGFDEGTDEVGADGFPLVQHARGW